MLSKLNSYFLIFLMTSFVTFANAATLPKKVIIDTDPGVDDAMAVLFALHSPDIEVIGITTIFGNVDTKLATLNALRLVELTEKKVPVAQGAVEPLVIPKNPSPDFVHGSDGLGNINLPVPNGKPILKNATQFIIETVLSDSENVTIVALGPLTNLALALAIEPRLAQNVKEVVLMGGAATVEGNVTPVAEANIWGDPHAADIVFTTPWQVTMVGLDVTHEVFLRDSILLSIKEKNQTIGKFIFESSRFYFDFHKSIGVTNGVYVHDPSAIAYLIDKSLFQTKVGAVRVATEGICIGQTVMTRNKEHLANPGPWFGKPKVKVCLGVNSERLLRLFESTFVGK